jgi:hypothetical protein
MLILHMFEYFKAMKYHHEISPVISAPPSPTRITKMPARHQHQRMLATSRRSLVSPSRFSRTSERRGKKEKERRKRGAGVIERGEERGEER